VEQDAGEVRSAQDLDEVFVGTFTHTLDPKRRLTIPSDWRDQVKTASTLYVLPDVEDKCLCAFTQREMSRRLGSIGHHSITDSKARKFARALASRSDLVSWDAQGRIRIKDDLLDFADIGTKVVMVGNFRFFELWNPDLLEQSGAMDQAEVAEAVRHVGF